MLPLSYSATICPSITSFCNLITCRPRLLILLIPEWGNLQYSIHLYLSPADTRQIIAKGWGEKHRLSKPETSIFDFKKYHIGDTYILIYGPRNEEEIEIVSKILQSSIRYMTGRDEVELPEWKKSLGGN